jgi:hypothetical protein
VSEALRAQSHWVLSMVVSHQLIPLVSEQMAPGCHQQRVRSALQIEAPHPRNNDPLILSGRGEGSESCFAREPGFLDVHFRPSRLEVVGMI